MEFGKRVKPPILLATCKSEANPLTHHQECFPILLPHIYLYHFELVHGKILEKGGPRKDQRVINGITDMKKQNVQ